MTKRQLLPERPSENVLAEPAIGFQTAFAGKAHATGRQCVDTVLPLGFDGLTCRRHSRAGGNPDLGISEIFQDCCNFKLLDSRLRGNDGLWGFEKMKETRPSEKRF